MVAQMSPFLARSAHWKSPAEADALLSSGQALSVESIASYHTTSDIVHLFLFSQEDDSLSLWGMVTIYDSPLQIGRFSMPSIRGAYPNPILIESDRDKMIVRKASQEKCSVK